MANLQLVFLGTFVAILAVVSSLNYRSNYKPARQSVKDLQTIDFLDLQRLLQGSRQTAPEPTAFQIAKYKILFARCDAAEPYGVLNQDDWEKLAAVLSYLADSNPEQTAYLNQTFVDLFNTYLKGYTNRINDWTNHILAMTPSTLQAYNKDLCKPFFFAMDLGGDGFLQKSEYVGVYDLFFNNGPLAEVVFDQMVEKAGKENDVLNIDDYTAAGLDFFSNPKSTCDKNIFGPISDEDLCSTCYL